MMKRSFLLIAILVTSARSAPAQETDQLAQIIAKIHAMYEADSANIFFDLKGVPTELIDKMEKLEDSTRYFGLTHKRQTTTVFIANHNEDWRATDVVTNREWPARKFLFGVSEGGDLFFCYWHGGMGKHLHFVFVEDKDYSKVTSFVTLSNYQILNKLDFDNKLQEIKSFKLNPLVTKSDIRVQRGNVGNNLDVF